MINMAMSGKKHGKFHQALELYLQGYLHCVDDTPLELDDDDMANGERDLGAAVNRVRAG